MDAASLVATLMTVEGRRDPYPLYTAARSLGPVAALADGRVLVQGYAAVNQVMRNPAFGIEDFEMRLKRQPEYADHPSVYRLGHSMLELNPPRHTRVRALMASLFTPRRIAAHKPFMFAAVEGLLEEMAQAGSGGRSVDFMDRFAVRLPVMVICNMLGIVGADHQELRRLADDLQTSREFMATVENLQAADAAATEFADYLCGIIDERRAAPGDDLISLLVRQADEGGLDGDELLSNLGLLIVAGFETTTNLLGNGLAVLIDQPEIAVGLADGSVPVAGFVEEVLRYDSPVQLTARKAVQDITFGDLTIDCGRNIVLMVGAANRDPLRYIDPDTFNPLRKDIQPLSLGAGAHYCIGAALARMEAAIAFSQLAARFPRLTLAADSLPVRRDRLSHRGFEYLPVACE